MGRGISYKRGIENLLEVMQMFIIFLVVMMVCGVYLCQNTSNCTFGVCAVQSTCIINK